MRRRRRWTAIFVGGLLGLASCGRADRADRATADDPAYIVVVVLDDVGEPVVGADVRVMQRGQHPNGVTEWSVADAVSDGEGRARLSHVDASATYRLELVPPDRRDDLAHRAVARWKPAAGTFHLRPGFTIRGVVRDPLGRSIERVQVNRPVLDIHPDGSRATADGRTLEPDGSFRFEHVARQHVPLIAVRHDEHDGEHNIGFALATPESPQVEIVLAEGDVPPEVVRRIEGLAPDHRALLIGPLDPAFRGGRERTVRLLAGLTELGGFTVWTGERDGTIRLESTIETYMSTLWIPPASADDDLSLFVPEVGFHVPDETLHLKPGYAIRGRVAGMAPHSDARVYAKGPGDERVPGRVGDDGAFAVRGLPEGRWSVVVEIGPVGAPTGSASVEADAGGTDIALQLK